MVPKELEADVAAVARIAAIPTILDVVCRITGMGFAAVARVTEARWIACAVRDDIAFGLAPGGELKVETTICHEIRQSREAVVIDDVAADATWCRHHTPATYGFRSYISMPIILPDQTFFGTLCAIDPRPAKLSTPEIRGMFKLFADLIAFHIDTGERLASSEASLRGERESSDLREQFIAVLGHDLRNPLAAIIGGTRVLRQESLSEKGSAVLALMQGAAGRMAGLIDNVLDFARGRLGGGLALDLSSSEPLQTALDQVVAELRAGAPDRIVHTQFDIAAPVECDRARIAQLLSNLLGNALTYGAAEQPVELVARTHDGEFELSVANSGPPIPPGSLQRLFLPFVRGDGPSAKGLGLGLYIASEIARAHHGTLTVESSERETRFTFRMPAKQPD